MLDVNLVGAFLGTQAVISPMRAGGGGAIVNVSSTAGCSGFPEHVAYGAAKWGLRGLTRTASVELGPLGIRVNCVVPGAVDTAMRPPGAPSTSRVASRKKSPRSWPFWRRRTPPRSRAVTSSPTAASSSAWASRHSPRDVAWSAAANARFLTGRWLPPTVRIIN